MNKPKLPVITVFRNLKSDYNNGCSTWLPTCDHDRIVTLCVNFLICLSPYIFNWYNISAHVNALTYYNWFCVLVYLEVLSRSDWGKYTQLQSVKPIPQSKFKPVTLDSKALSQNYLNLNCEAALLTESTTHRGVMALGTERHKNSVYFQAKCVIFVGCFRCLFHAFNVFLNKDMKRYLKCGLASAIVFFVPLSNQNYVI
jgi:hypothetical protein